MSQHRGQRRRRSFGEWLQDDLSKMVGPITMVRLLRRHPTLILYWVSYLLVANGVAVLILMPFGSVGLMRENFTLPSMLASFAIGKRLYLLKIQEEQVDGPR